MNQPEFNLSQAHQHFARQTNSEVWELLSKPQRTPAEDERMIHAAHTSLYHWLHAGNVVNEQRGLWLLSRVYTVLKHPRQALYYANRCLELTRQHHARMKDFDIAYAHEAVARANALAGNLEAGKTHLKQALEAGEAISNPEDRNWFEVDLNNGDWYSLRD